MRTLALTSALLLCLPALASSQTVLEPSSRIVWEQDPGRTRTGTSSVPRPIGNVAYDVRVDGGTPQPLSLDGACQPAATAGIFTCRAFPPSMTEGTHTLEIRAFPNPAEPGVNPSAFSAPISVAVIIVTAPGTPASPRLEVPPGS